MKKAHSHVMSFPALIARVNVDLDMHRQNKQAMWPADRESMATVLRVFLTFLLALALAGCPGNPSPSSTGSPHVALGIPVSSTGDEDVVEHRPQFVVGVSRRRASTAWASWRLTAADLGTVPRRHGAFMQDTMLPPGWPHASDQDYHGSGMDKGHLVPSEDRSATVEDSAATFVLANVLPQQPALNRGPWEDLEKYCRRLAHHGNDLFLVAGGVFSAEPARIGNGVPVPSAFWKVAVVVERGQATPDASSRVIAAILPNEANVSHDWRAYKTTVAAVEKAAELRLFANLREDVRRVLEAKGVEDVSP